MLPLPLQMFNFIQNHIACRDILRNITFTEIIVDEMYQFVYCFVPFCVPVLGQSIQESDGSFEKIES